MRLCRNCALGMRIRQASAPRAPRLEPKREGRTLRPLAEKVAFQAQQPHRRYLTWAIDNRLRYHHDGPMRRHPVTGAERPSTWFERYSDWLAPLPDTLAATILIGSYLIALAVLIFGIAILVNGVNTFLPASWADSQTCEENPDQYECHNYDARPY